MGNACCGPAEPEHKPPQSDGELAGKIKFLSTPSFCEFTDTSNPVKNPGENKWFLCVFAPLTGHGVAFTAYQNKTNTLMVKYLVDADIVKEKERQNISISYNMFFKALSTEVARAGRVGAKVTFTSPETVNLDCKIMIAGATSRRPDNFSVELRKIEVTPDALYHYVLEPICTQYYKRRANEGWNVERVDISREKIYGEYETNFILRSTRLDSNLEMLREIAPKVLQLRREQALLRERREKLLAQLCIAKTLLASNEKYPERLVRAIPRENRPDEITKSLRPEQLQEIDHPSTKDFLYLPSGHELSSTIPNVSRPIPSTLPQKSSEITALNSQLPTSSPGAGASTSNANNNNNNSSVTAPPSFSYSNFGPNCSVSRGVIEVALEMGKTLQADLKTYETKHQSAQQQAVQSSSGYRSGSFAGTPKATSSQLPHMLTSPIKTGGDNNDPINSNSLNNSSFTSVEIRDEDYYSMDLSVFKPDVQAKFHKNLVSENERNAVFRCWRSFLSVSRFDPFSIEGMTDDSVDPSSGQPKQNFKSPNSSPTSGPAAFANSGTVLYGHSFAITLALAIGYHQLPENLGLTVEAVHELCTHLESIQSRSETFFNSMKAADRVQFMSLFLKVIQSGEVPRLATVPPIEVLCCLCAAAGCRTDLHPPLEPYGHPSSTLAALHIDSLNERHSLAVTISALRKCGDGIRKFITPTFHKLLADLILAIDPARHNIMFNIFSQKVKSATNFSRTLEERRLMYAVLLVGADSSFFARIPDIKSIWMKKLDATASSSLSQYKRSNSVCFFSNSGSNDNRSNHSGTSGSMQQANVPPTTTIANANAFTGPQCQTYLSGFGGAILNANGSVSTLAELRMPLKINLPSTFRIGAAAGFGNITDDVLPSSLILRSEMRAGFTGGSSPSCMQGITRKSHEMYEQIAVPSFTCLKTLAQDAVDAHRVHVDTLESTLDGNYSIFTRIAKCGYF